MRFFRYQLSENVYRRVQPLLGGSLFCSHDFVKLWEAVGGKGVCWIAEDASSVAAALPGVEFGIGPLRRFQAMPDGLYGRLFVAPELSADRSRLVSDVMGALVKARYAKTYLFDFHASLAEHPGFRAAMETTTLVDISDPDWQPPHQKLRAEIRKAEREGIELTAFNADEHLADFLRLMRQSEERTGRKPRYPEEFFRRLATLGNKEERIDWIWCRHDGCPVASHIYLVEGDMVLAWQIYSDRSYSFLKPNQYILFATSRKWSVKGTCVMNHGSTEASASGVMAFKSKWGGREYVYRSYRRITAMGRLW